MKYSIVLCFSVLISVSEAKAGFHVNVRADGKEIIVSNFFGRDSTIRFENGIAAVMEAEDNSSAACFINARNAIQLFKEKGWTVFAQPDPWIAIEAGDFYFAMIIATDRGMVALLFPVYFYPDGNSLLVDENKPYHYGRVEFNDDWAKTICREEYRR